MHFSIWGGNSHHVSFPAAKSFTLDYIDLKRDEEIESLYLLVDFVKHCRIVIFFRVVVEANHAILLVNAGIDLPVFNLHAKEPKEDTLIRYNKQ